MNYINSKFFEITCVATIQIIIVENFNSIERIHHIQKHRVLSNYSIACLNASQLTFLKIYYKFRQKYCYESNLMFNWFNQLVFKQKWASRTVLILVPTHWLEQLWYWKLNLNSSFFQRKFYEGLPVLNEILLFYYIEISLESRIPRKYLVVAGFMSLFLIYLWWKIYL